MKLKQIEEIATRQVPIWQPALLVTLLLAGYIVVPLFGKNTPSKTAEPPGSTLGVETTRAKEQVNKSLDEGINTVVKPVVNKLQQEVGSVLGIAQQAAIQTVQDVASKSADQAKEFVFDNTLGKILQNINTLPGDQQDLIKKAICK